PIMRCASASPWERVQPLAATKRNASVLSPARERPTARVRSRSALKKRELFELLIAGLNLVPRQIAETVDAELLAAEAAHHASIDHGAPQLGHIDRAVGGIDAFAGEVTHEAAGETIASTRGIENAFEQIARRHEVL